MADRRADLGDRPQPPRLEPEGQPQLGPQTIGLRWLQLIGDDHPLDHVADDRRPRATLELHCDDRAIGHTTQGAVDAGDARRAAEAGRNQASTTNLAANGAGGVGEVEGGVADWHVISVAQGCYSRAVTPLG